MVKTSNGTSKAYIALFTCAVTRAIHLELVSNQSTENFLLALKRFIARRGLCKVIYSDNAKTFKRADQDLKELWKSIKERSTKSCLKRILGKASLNFEELTTILTEVEAVLNSRFKVLVNLSHTQSYRV